jgi:hypothetical protein
MAQVSRCTSHLRQIGLAYRMYREDYDQYPGPQGITLGSYVRDRRILFCPEDNSIRTMGAASSYRFRATVPPDFTPLAGMVEIDSSIVLTGCQHHLEQQQRVLKGDNTRLTPPRYPFHLVLRAGGPVERIHLSRVKRFLDTGQRRVLRTLYPGEPGYAEVSVSRGEPDE